MRDPRAESMPCVRSVNLWMVGDSDFARLSGIHHSHIILGITHHPSNSCLCAHIGTVFSNTGDVLPLKLCSMWFLMCLILIHLVVIYEAFCLSARKYFPSCYVHLGMVHPPTFNVNAHDKDHTPCNHLQTMWYWSPVMC